MNVSSALLWIRAGVIVLAFVVVSGCASHPEQAYRPYHFPLGSPGANFAALPPQVQTTVLAEAGTAQIDTIRILYAGNLPIYRVTFRNSIIYPPLHIGSDGSVVTRTGSVLISPATEIAYHAAASTIVKVSDVPAAVMTAAREKAPAENISVIHKELWGERPIYIITYKDPSKNPKLYILADGTILQSGSR